MKKLYYSLIILLVVVVGLVLPQIKASTIEFDDSAVYIGIIEAYERDVNGKIIGVEVTIINSSLPVGDYPYHWVFELEYFNANISRYSTSLLGKRVIWNNFDKSGELYDGTWWVLTDYNQMRQDLNNSYVSGWDDGYDVGDYYGYMDGYQDGSINGYYEGFADGYEEGLEDGYQDGRVNGYYEGHEHGYDFGYSLGYDDGFDDGYRDGYYDGREQVLNSIENINMGILYQDVVLLNGVKDEIIDNEILVDRVGVAVFDGSENWQRYNFDVEPYSTIAFLFISSFPSVYDSNLAHYISNILINGLVWYTDDVNRIWISDYGSVVVRLLKSDLVVYGYDDNMTDQQKVNIFKQWLAAQKDAGEPLTVWYQYAEPKQYDLVSLLTNADGSFVDGYNEGYNEGRVHVQRENKSLLSVIPITIGSIWLMISDFLSFEVFGLNLWAILMMFAGFSLLVLIIKMVI